MPRRSTTHLGGGGAPWLLLLTAVACTDEVPPVDGSVSFGEESTSHLALSANHDSLGPIGATTPFDGAELEGLFPGASVVRSVGSTEGESYPTLRVVIAGDTVAEVRSRDEVVVHSVEVFGTPAAGGLGTLVGNRFDAVFGDGAEPDCRAGMEEESGLVLCGSPLSARVTLVFAGSFDGPDGLLPPQEVLASWTVQRVIWRP